MRSIIGKILSAKFYQRPIFQVGASRSGTIVLYKALGTHPEIFSMPSEDPYVTYVAGSVIPFEFGEEIDYFNESVKLSKDYLYKKLRNFCFESAAGPFYGYKTLIKYVLSNPLSILNKRYWCVKCFPLQEHAKALRILYPECKFIYIVRNGIDVVQSRRTFPAFRDQEFSSHCNFWLQAAEKFSYLYGYKHAVSIQQEQLLTNPDDVFRKITRHLGVSHHENPVKYVTTTLVHSRGDKETRENVDVRQSLLERPPSHEDWSIESRDTFKSICGEMMVKLGYDIPF